MTERVLPIAVLVSGSGTTLQNLIDLIAAGQLSARIVMVIGSRPGLAGIQRAADARLPHSIVDHKSVDAAEFSRRVFKLGADAGAELICLAGWLCLLEIPEAFAGRVMNIHPALLPGFGGKGMYGRRVHQAVLDHGCKVSGCTVHFVDASYDTGPIILQRCCPVLEGDSAESLAQRVFEEEKLAYPAAIRLFQQSRLRVAGRVVLVLPG